MGAGPSMEDHLFNLRFTAKQLNREAKKCEQNAGANKLKCKKAMEQGNMDGARIFAESAIRDKNTALNYLRLASRIDAVAQRVNTAVKMQTLTKDMTGIVKSMESVMKTMNVEKISKVMDQFEGQFASLDASTAVMQQSMYSSAAHTMPESEIDQLMQQVAEEHGLEVSLDVNALPSGAHQIGQKQQVTQAQQEQEKNVLVVGQDAAAAANNKGGDNKPAGDGGAGGGGGGSMADDN